MKVFCNTCKWYKKSFYLCKKDEEIIWFKNINNDCKDYILDEELNFYDLDTS